MGQRSVKHMRVKEKLPSWSCQWLKSHGQRVSPGGVDWETRGRGTFGSWTGHPRQCFLYRDEWRGWLGTTSSQCWALLILPEQSPPQTEIPRDFVFKQQYPLQISSWNLAQVHINWKKSARWGMTEMSPEVGSEPGHLSCLTTLVLGGEGLKPQRGYPLPPTRFYSQRDRCMILSWQACSMGDGTFRGLPGTYLYHGAYKKQCKGNITCLHVYQLLNQSQAD